MVSPLFGLGKIGPFHQGCYSEPMAGPRGEVTIKIIMSTPRSPEGSRLRSLQRVKAAVAAAPMQSDSGRNRLVEVEGHFELKRSG